MFDYHVHSTHSIDAQDSMARLIERAGQIGLAEIGFADHLDLNPADSGCGYLDLERSFSDIEALKSGAQRIVVRAGLEVGEPHLYQKEMKALLDGWPFDFIIGAIHWVGDDLVGTDAYFGRHADPVRAYLEAVRAMVEEDGFDVVAHLDFPTRYMAQWGEYWDPATSRDLVEDILQAIIDRGMALEVNTASYRRGLDRPHPPSEVLTWYLDMGGKLLTLGSDAHSASVLGSGVPEAAGVLRQLGFEEVTGYAARKPYSLPLNTCPGML